MRYAAVYLAIVFAFTQCKKDEKNNVQDPCTSVNQTIVTGIDMPKTGLQNQDVAVMVKWPYFNGCNVFNHFEESRKGNEVLIKTFVSTNSCAICTQDAGFRITQYNFKPTGSGVYVLKFIQPSNTFIVDTVTIQ